MNPQKPILTILNHHSKACGLPPEFAIEKHHYLGYWENELSEQWVFVYDRKTREGFLYGGEVNWAKTYPVVDGTVPELVLSMNETLWLRLCWETAKTWET